MTTATVMPANGSVAAGDGGGRCKRAGCGRPLPPGERGRSRQFCSDECRIRHYNGLRGHAAVPAPPTDGPEASLGRLSQLLAEASRLAGAVSAEVAAADPGRVAMLLAEAEAARRRAEAHAATASAQAAEAAESADAAWEAADAAQAAADAAGARARAAEDQARELEQQAGSLSGQLGAALARIEAAERDAARAAAAREQAARELAAAATGRAERAEAALDAERAERRALTDKLTAVPAQHARTRARATTEKQP